MPTRFMNSISSNLISGKLRFTEVPKSYIKRSAVSYVNCSRESIEITV